MEIKDASIKDIRRISYLIHKNTDSNPNNYSKEQIKAWKKYNTPAQIGKQLKDRKVFCAFQKEKLVGTIALKENFISGFYVSHSIRGKGIGSKLINHLEDFARKNKIKKLYLTSTPSAFKFYLNKEYLTVEKVKLTIYGIDYLETKMEKEL